MKSPFLSINFQKFSSAMEILCNAMQCNAMVICAISIFALCDNNYLISSRKNGQMKGVERMKNVDGTHLDP